MKKKEETAAKIMILQYQQHDDLIKVECNKSCFCSVYQNISLSSSYKQYTPLSAKKFPMQGRNKGINVNKSKY